MRGSHQVRQIFSRPQVGVYVQEVLNAVAVIGIKIASLLEHRSDPQGCDAELLEVVQLGLDAPERAALPSVCAGLCPTVPTPRLGIGRHGPRFPESVAVEQGAFSLSRIAEPVR